MPLPVEDIKPALLTALAKQPLVLLSAPPGSGKSTCLPLWLIEQAIEQQTKIILLQPRRVAAKSVACYLASQLGQAVGQHVGYRVKNDTKVSADTALEVVTDGILIQQIQQDPELEQVNLIIFDEFHERSLQSDLAFALARDCQLGLRDDLTLLLMSATLDKALVSTQFAEAPLIESHGRSFPVTVSYQPPTQFNLWRQQLLTSLKRWCEQGVDSALVFLPGSYDIRFLADALVDFVSDTLSIHPLYGDLSLSAQQQAIAPAPVGKRKLVLATNIAETSLTIDGITTVFDAGLEKVAVFNKARLINQLQQRQICKASAIQRAGRAGRTAPGHCIRFFSEDDFSRRPMQSEHDIMQSDLLPLVMQVARWGAKSCQQLPFVELPKPQDETLAWQTLQALSLVDENRRLTAHGGQVAQLPLHPRFAHMVISAQPLAQKLQQPQLPILAALLASLLEEGDFYDSQQRRDDADITHRIMDLFASGAKPKHKQIKHQASQLLSRLGLKSNDLSLALQSLSSCGLLLLMAYPEWLAKKRKQGNSVLMANGQGADVNDQDPFFGHDFIVAAQLLQQQNKNRVVLASVLDFELACQLELVQPKQVHQLYFDDELGKIRAEIEQRVGAIVLSSRPDTSDISHEAVAQMWCQKVQQRGLDYLPWDSSATALLARWRWLNQQAESSVLPKVDDNTLLTTIDQWLSPFVGTIRSKNQWQQLNLTEVLLAQLDYSQQQLLNQQAPAQFMTSTGRKIAIDYRAAQAPLISLPMQEMYGIKQTPVVGLKQTPLTLELLSPAKRPIQVTRDLAGFWQGSYREVQKEMKGRYPKHFWPDDPANAQATTKTKKAM